MDDIESRRARLAAALDYSAALEKRTEEMSVDLPVMTYETPRQIRTQVADRLENEFTTRLLAMEARLSQRMDAIEGRLQTMWQGLEVLADEGGGAVGALEKRLRTELHKEANALRSEVTLGVSANPLARRPKPGVSRQVEKDNALRN